jgi:hypothetical protein
MLVYVKGGGAYALYWKQTEQNMMRARKFTLQKHSGKLDEFSSSGLIWFDLG